MAESTLGCERGWHLLEIRRLLGVGAAVWVALTVASCGGAATSASPLIRINQVGFTPDSQKLAVVPDPAPSHFEVRIVDGGVVFSGELTPVARWEFSDEHVRIAR